MFCLQNLGLPRMQSPYRGGPGTSLHPLFEAMWSSHLSTPSASRPPTERGSTTSPILQMGNLRLREVESLANTGKTWARTQF